MRNVKLAALVGLSMLLVFSIAASQDGTRVHRIERLTVIDANGKRVGPVVDLSSPLAQMMGTPLSPTVALDVEGQLVVLAVTKDRFIGSADSVFFESSDCSGTPFLANFGFLGLPLVPTQGLVPAAAALNDGNIYVIDPDNPSVVLDFQALSQAGPLGQCIQADPSPSIIPEAVRARRLVIGEHFEPPFRLRWARERDGDH